MNLKKQISMKLSATPGQENMKSGFALQVKESYLT
jgi:hypothetical protein|tara:strand:+ start:736 stop:840 length:105 start_codon:yes stop_codon:yes gene_type:complete